MKKHLLTLAAIALATMLAAQPRTAHRHNNNGHAHMPATPSIIVEAQQGESFQVYVDGDQINFAPNSKVIVENLDSRLHEVIVVLTHPARKAGTVQLYAEPHGTQVIVDYDHRRQQMLLYTPQGGHAPAVNPRPLPPLPLPEPAVTPEPAVASDQWVNEMVALLNQQDFDSEKLTTAKGLLTNGMLLTTNQIVSIVKTLDFSTSQVDFLKAAYPYCSDPENYERALAILTFSSDRQTVRKYINSLQQD